MITAHDLMSRVGLLLLSSLKERTGKNISRKEIWTSTSFTYCGLTVSLTMQQTHYWLPTNADLEIQCTCNIQADCKLDFDQILTKEKLLLDKRRSHGQRCKQGEKAVNFSQVL